MHLKLGRNSRALEGPHTAAGRQAGSRKLFRFLRVFFPFLSFPFFLHPPPHFLFFFHFFFSPSACLSFWGLLNLNEIVSLRTI